MRDKEIVANFKCLDCGHSTLENSPKADHYYMVIDPIWRQATKPEERDKMLCLDCLSARLERPLRKRDFTKAPVNWMADFMLYYIMKLEP